jgi:hypothetical protein
LYRYTKSRILVDAWSFFARLWDGGCGVTFESDVVALAEARDANAAAAADLAARLDASRREENELQLALDRMVNQRLEGAGREKESESAAEAVRKELAAVKSEMEKLRKKLTQTVSDKERQEELTADALYDLGQARVAFTSKASECGALHTALRKAQVDARATAAQINFIKGNLRECSVHLEKSRASEAAAEARGAAAEAARALAEAAVAAVNEENLRIKMRVTLLDADVIFKRDKIAALELTIKEKEEKERHAKLVKVQMIMELNRTKGKVEEQKKRAEGLEEELAGERAARAEDKRVAERHIAELKTELKTEREARKIVMEQHDATKKKLEFKRMKKRWHKKKRKEAEEEVERLTATVAHRDAAVLAFTAEAWRLRAMSLRDRRFRADAEAVAKNANELMAAAEAARAESQAKMDIAEKESAESKALAVHAAVELAAAKDAFQWERKTLTRQLLDLEHAREDFMHDLHVMTDKHKTQGELLVATKEERDEAQTRVDALEIELEALKMLLESERKKWQEDMENSLAKAKADLEAKARASAWSSKAAAAKAARTKEEEAELAREKLTDELAFSKETMEEFMKGSKDRMADLEAQIVELKADVVRLEGQGEELQILNDMLTDDVRTVQTRLDDKCAEFIELTRKHNALEVESAARGKRMDQLASLLAAQRDAVVKADEAVGKIAEVVKTAVATTASEGGAAAEYDWTVTRGSKVNTGTLDDGAAPGGEGAFAEALGDTVDVSRADSLLIADVAFTLIKRGAARVLSPLEDAAAAVALLGEDFEKCKLAKAAAEEALAHMRVKMLDTLSNGKMEHQENEMLMAKLGDTQATLNLTREMLVKAAGALDRYDVVAGNLQNALQAQDAKEEALCATVSMALTRLEVDVDGGGLSLAYNRPRV